MNSVRKHCALARERKTKEFPLAVIARKLRNCIDILIPRIHTHVYSRYFNKLLERAQHQGVMLISDTAGMGKSTALTHPSEQIKQKIPTRWVVRIDLNDHRNTEGTETRTDR
jgi:phosphohistidine phosphatase SixA